MLNAEGGPRQTVLHIVPQRGRVACHDHIGATMVPIDGTGS